MNNDFLSVPEIQKNNSFNFIRLVCCLIVIYEHCISIANLSLPVTMGGGTQGLPLKFSLS